MVELDLFREEVPGTFQFNKAFMIPLIATRMLALIMSNVCTWRPSLLKKPTCL